MNVAAVRNASFGAANARTKLALRRRGIVAPAFTATHSLNWAAKSFFPLPCSAREIPSTTNMLCSAIAIRHGGQRFRCLRR